MAQTLAIERREIQVVEHAFFSNLFAFGEATMDVLIVDQRHFAESHERLNRHLLESSLRLDTKTKTHTWTPHFACTSRICLGLGIFLGMRSAPAWR